MASLYNVCVEVRGSGLGLGLAKWSCLHHEHRTDVVRKVSKLYWPLVAIRLDWSQYNIHIPYDDTKHQPIQYEMHAYTV